MRDDVEYCGYSGVVKVEIWKGCGSGDLWM